MKWHWEVVDVSRSGSSGDISKLFRNEPVKRPGVMALNAPPPDATTMAREVIQNSWDAARELRASLGDAPSPDFDLTFDFVRLRGDSASDLLEVVGFEELAERAAPLDWKKIGLPSESLLKSRSPEEVSLLRIDEQGTSGMHGPWEGDQSKMYLAMVTYGYTEKLSGAGGSYGYGKAGLVRGSETRTVIAYSCFRERQDDPGVTRRLLGMTYWGPHKHGDGLSYTGFARYGHVDPEGHVRPFENDAADDIARSLGLELRDPDSLEELGTTFLLLDPTVQPVDLRRAVERNWWPALEADPSFGVEIKDYDDALHMPRARQSTELAPFIRSFEIARLRQDNSVASERKFEFQRLAIDGDRYELGVLGLVGNPDGWSFPPPDDEVDHRSLVALIRGPHMVVEYFEAGQARPYVRGTFLAHDDIDDLLRQTEPRGHDAWQTTPGDDSIESASPVVAKAVLDRIKGNVRTFRKELKPPVPDRREVRLPELERLFRMVIEGEGPEPSPPPPPEPRLISIQVLEQRPEMNPTNPSLIRLHARIAFALSPNFEDGDEAFARLSVRYKFVEDDRAGEDCPVRMSPPDGFEVENEHSVTGPLGRDPVVMEVVSDPYDPDWTGRLVAEAELVTVETAA